MSPEWAWTLIAVLGMAVGIWGASDSWQDLRAVRTLGIVGNGARQVARGDFRAEVVRITIQWSWFWVGLDALVRSGSGSWSPAAVVLVGSVALLSFNSLMSLLDRIRLRHHA